MSLPDPATGLQRASSSPDIVSDTGNVLDTQASFKSPTYLLSVRHQLPLSQPIPVVSASAVSLQAVSKWLSQHLPFKIISKSSLDLLAEVG
jgi:hypothetical protein